jgi:1-aminocyclopropane-1-carboxylate deaminase/D-cysteine desulfhydrase-like pyridoxal-dependent ACC family enzyme
MENPFRESPLEKLEEALFSEKQITVYLKRDDLIHQHIQGNKWRKLKYNLYQARLNKLNTLLTFGGPYSNHIYAVAAAAKLFHFRAIGIIRGNEPEAKSSTLQFASQQGMELYYMDKEMYREKEKPENIESLQVQIGDFYYVPEGGTNLYALEGVAEIIDEIHVPYDILCTACGTGGTLAGLVAGLKGEKQVIGFSALKGADKLTERVNELVNDYGGETFNNFQINFDYHFGGYAKVKPELIDFIKRFKLRHDIYLEPVYTGKMLFGLYNLIEQNSFEPGTRIVALHTGGLQGINGYAEYFGGSWYQPSQ